jgi:phage shock protein PspC (stress-responsive transcriptional regulator)
MTTPTLPSHRPQQLTRSSSDKKLSGVAGGLGAYFGVDPLVFRIGFAVTTLLSGAGAIAYLALLLFTPTDAGDPAMFGPRQMAI